MKQDNNEGKIARLTELINASLASFNIMYTAGFDDLSIPICDRDGNQGTVRITSLLQEITHAMIRARAELEVENQKTK